MATTRLQLYVSLKKSEVKLGLAHSSLVCYHRGLFRPSHKTTNATPCDPPSPPPTPIGNCYCCGKLFVWGARVVCIRRSLGCRPAAVDVDAITFVLPPCRYWYGVLTWSRALSRKLRDRGRRVSALSDQATQLPARRRRRQITPSLDVRWCIGLFVGERYWYG